MASSFVHLHNHTEYSMLDGASRHAPLFAEVARLGMPAVAMTDHGNMFGAHDFYHEAAKHDVKPILGIEAYVAPSTRFSRQQEFWGQRANSRDRIDAAVEGGKDVSGGGRYTHMTLLAKDPTGVRNLFRLSSLASYEGYYMKPRMDRELLHQHAQGVIATTGCPSGEVQTRLRLGQYEQAKAAAATYQEIFGKENYFLEVMDHGLDIERNVRADLLRIAREVGIPLLATNDSHYVTEDQADTHDSLLCVGVGRNKADDRRFRFDGSGYYIKSPTEMRHLWRELPEACDNTLLVADMVGDYSEVFERVYRMPSYPVQPGQTQEGRFRQDVHDGLIERFGPDLPRAVTDQADYEMEVITSKGYASYFLVVADFINWAKDNGIRVGPGRGSGAGSLCAYAMRITDLDPLEHGLVFERFLNPERESMPDFDIDFDDRRRSEVIAYVTGKYGAEYTALVNTFGRMKAKAAVKDAAKILGHPFSLAEKITKSLPPDAQGRTMPLTGVFDPEHPRYGEADATRQMCAADPEVKQIMDTAQGMEGVIRSTGVHAAAVILSSEPLMDVIPMHRRDDDGALITGFDYPSCEDMGLVKMDFLGLSNLTTVTDALANIETNRGVTVDIDALTRDPTDPAVYDLLQRGDTLGVFQFDSSGYRSLCRLMRPDKFGDISALGALYRPGPMGAESHTNYAHRKNGRQEITPIHPELAEPLQDILAETYGLIVYQEQVQQIAVRVAGYTLGRADILRRAMGKKKKEVLDAEYASFEAGMLANGYSTGAVKALWDILVPFSDYAFNKAHSAAYGMVSYWTAYLKAHYPTEFMAALLTAAQGDKDELAIILRECRQKGIKVLPPDVNESQTHFTPVGEDIRFGLTAVRNVGAGVVEAIAAERQAAGPFTSFEDFVRRLPAGACNRKTLESLIQAGAFATLGHTRMGLMHALDPILNDSAAEKKAASVGQVSLFDEPVLQVTIPDTEWDRPTLLSYERDMLGLYVSDHPLNGLEGLIEQYATITAVDLIEADEVDERQRVSLVGLITSVEAKRSKRTGKEWAILTVEDLTASVKVLAFPRAFEAHRALLAVDSVCWVEGNVMVQEDGSKEIALNDVRPLDEQVEAALSA